MNSLMHKKTKENQSFAASAASDWSVSFRSLNEVLLLKIMRDRYTSVRNAVSPQYRTDRTRCRPSCSPCLPAAFRRHTVDMFHMLCLDIGQLSVFKDRYEVIGISADPLSGDPEDIQLAVGIDRDLIH